MKTDNLLLQMAQEKVEVLSKLTHEAANAITAQRLEINAKRHDLQRAECQYNDNVRLLEDSRQTLAELQAVVRTLRLN